jgi:hypothetical protein
MDLDAVGHAEDRQRRADHRVLDLGVVVDQLDL